MRVTIRRIGLSAGLILALSFYLIAQTNVGSITGTLKDASGAVVPAAEVELTQPATGRKYRDTTNSLGQYHFRKLDVGEYEIKIGLSGFKTVERSGIRVVSAEVVTLDFELQVGASSEVLTVTGQIPAVDTQTANLGTTRTLDEIGRLPVVLAGNSSRSAMAFARTVSGVSFNPQGGQDFMSISRSQINGSMAGTWGYQIDGVEGGMGEAESGSDFISPIPEAIEEFNLSANTAPSSGFNGGVSINLTMKSGTNQIHGSVYEYMRNSALNARTFFDTSGKASAERQNNGGFVVGGPVWIPKVYDGRNRTFFFTTLDIFRWRSSPSGNTATVATPLMRQGNFSELLGAQIGTDALGRPILQGQIYDPRTTRSDGRGGFIRDPFPGNVIPADRLSSISKSFQELQALPTRPGTQLNWVGTNKPLLVDKDQWTLKLDHIINDRHRVAFSYEATIPLFLPAVSGASGHSYIDNGAGYLLNPAVSNGFIDDRDSYRYRFNYTWTVNQDILFSLRAGITRNPNRILSRYPFSGPGSTFAQDIGLKGTLDPHSPVVNIEGGNGFPVTFNYYLVASQKTPVNVDLSWIKGSHSFKFGADYILLPFTSVNNNTHGNFNFQDRETGLPGVTGTGAGRASFMLGEVDNSSVASLVDVRANSGAYGFFWQDSWRMTPKLTLTYGVRWNIYIPMTELQDKISTFDPNLPNPGAGGRLGALSIYGDGTGRNGIHSVSDYYYKALGPHFGFAYAINPKTVVRGSYAVSYGPAWQKWYGSLGPTTPTAGFGATLTAASLDNGVTPAFNWQNGFPLKFPTFPVTNPALQNGSALGYVDRSENRPPTSQNIGFEVSRELPGQMSIRVGYVANLSHRLPSTGGVDLNAIDMKYLSLGTLLNANINSAEAQAAGIPVPYAGFNGSVAQALRPYPQYLGIPVLGAQIGVSTYHAVQANFTKRIGQGLTFLVAYTYSKNLSNLNFPGFTGFGTTVTQHPALRSKSKALLDKDRPQLLNVSWAYDLPIGSGKRYLGGAKGVVNQIVGGWRISAIQNYESGDPMRITSRATIPGGFSGIWPNYVPGAVVEQTTCSDYNPGDPTRNVRLNINAFTTPAPFTLGNFSRPPNVRNCAFMDEALGIEKRFPIHEQFAINFGSSIQNVFNRHSFWAAPGTDIGNPAAFGRHTSTSPPRSIQFYLKVTF